MECAILSVQYCMFLTFNIDFAYFKKLLKVFDLENSILRDVKNVKNYIIPFLDYKTLVGVVATLVITNIISIFYIGYLIYFFGMHRKCVHDVNMSWKKISKHYFDGSTAGSRLVF